MRRSIINQQALYIMILSFTILIINKGVDARLRGTVEPEDNEVFAIEGQYIIIFEQDELQIMNDDTVTNIANDLSDKYEINPERTFCGTTMYGFSATNVTKDEAEYILQNEAGVILVEQDALLSLEPDPLDEQKLEINGNDDEISWGLKRIGGYQNATNSTKRAFVVDTGVAPLDGLNIDFNLAKSFLSDYNDSEWYDENGHGTHVAGIIAGRDMSQNIIGVAAGATIVPIRVMDRYGRGTISSVISALAYIEKVVQTGDVINISLGGPVTQTSMDRAIENLANRVVGVYFTIAAGNARRHAELFTPARATHENVYTVSAIDKRDCMAYFSNYGSPPIDYAAPGVNIVSFGLDGKRMERSGTSMAAPHVAGILLLGNITNDGAVPCGNFDMDRYPIAHR